MDYETIQYAEQDQIGQLTLNRPRTINAVNQQMVEELEDLFAKLQRQQVEARVLILHGAGEKGFCSGLDMKETAVSMLAESIEAIYNMQQRFSLLYHKLRCLPQPIIAAVHGAAAGAGLSFALSADLRVITPDAKFTAAYINIGLGGADLACSYFLPRLIGAGRAHEFMLTGAPMHAEEAMALGLASRLVERDQLLDTARELAMVMTSKNPLGLRLTKEAINQNLGVASLEQALHLENRNQAFLIAATKLG